MITFAGQPVVDPGTLYDQCQRFGLRTDWIGLANGITNPMGTKSAMGHLLMTRQSLNQINFNAVQTLVVFDPATGTKMVYNNLAITECEAITPSYPGDPNAVFHVIVRDLLYLWNFNTVGKAYNMRETPTGNYAAATLVGGTTQYTWQQMWSDVWSTLPAAYAGTAPTLPSSLTGYPEAFDFYNSFAAEALQLILDRIGCTLTFDPVGVVFRVAKLGDSTAYQTFLNSVAALAKLRLDDTEGLGGNLGRVPAAVAVSFTQSPPTAYGTAPFYPIVVADPNPSVAGQTPGTVVWIDDDMTAEYQGNTLTNLAALTARANERAASFFTAIRRSGPILRKLLFSGAQTSILPGEWVSEVSWFDRGGGIMTEVKLVPDNGGPMRAWERDKHPEWRETEICRLTGGWNSGSGFGGWSGSGGGDLMDGYVLIFDCTTATWSDRFPCWLVDINDSALGFAAGSGNLGQSGVAPPVRRFVSRFLGYALGRPVYGANVGNTAAVSAVTGVVCNSGGLTVTTSVLNFAGGMYTGKN